MKTGWNKIVLTVIAIAALLVAGCAGTDTSGNVTPTPSPAPQATSSPAATPAWTTVSSPARTTHLYDMSSLNWYEFRFGHASEITNSSGHYRFEFDDTTYSDVPARHTREIFTDLILGKAGSPDSIIDAYARKTDNSILGGHVKMFAGEQVTMDQDVAGSQIAGMMSKGYPYITTLDRDARLTYAGTDTLSLNGKQYACTMYRFTVDGITRTAWYTPDAPAPLKVAWSLVDESKPVAVTVTLLGWG